MIPEEKISKVNALLRLFRIKGKEADKQLTTMQKELFYALVFQPSKRLIVITPTQYGKSLVTALACIILSCIKEELVAVVAPTNNKARIIMRYYIEHLGDNVLFYSQLEKNTRLERLRQEESKERIILRNGGGVYALSVNQTNFSRSIEAAMGMGAKNTIQDESCLIRDDTEATIFRMIGGEGSDAFYCKIGNPFYKKKPYSHFYKSWRDPKYKKIFVDYLIGLEEGRYTEEFIEEARRKPKFDVLYECKFPRDEDVDTRGYSSLLRDEDLDRAYVDKLEIFGRQKIGVDVSGGGRNYSVIVLRGTNGAKVQFRERLGDTMALVGRVLELAKETPSDIYVDSIGVGHGVFDRINEAILGDTYLSSSKVYAVNVGEKSDDDRFINKRAEMSWLAREWILNGGKLLRHDGWEEVLDVKYKIQSDRRVKIMSKEEMLREGIQSPDVWDAFVLTFYKDNKENSGVSSYTPKFREMSGLLRKPRDVL